MKLSSKVTMKTKAGADTNIHTHIFQITNIRAELNYQCSERSTLRENSGRGKKIQGTTRRKKSDI